MTNQHVARVRSKLLAKLLCDRGGSSVGRGHWRAGDHKLHCSGAEGSTRAESLGQKPGVRGAQRTRAEAGSGDLCNHTAHPGDLQSGCPRLVAPSSVWDSGKEAGSVGAGDRTRQRGAWLCPDWRLLACLCSSCFHELAQKVGRLSEVISKVSASQSEFLPFYLESQLHVSPDSHSTGQDGHRRNKGAHPITHMLL